MWVYLHAHQLQCHPCLSHYGISARASMKRGTADVSVIILDAGSRFGQRSQGSTDHSYSVKHNTAYPNKHSPSPYRHLLALSLSVCRCVCNVISSFSAKPGWSGLEQTGSLQLFKWLHLNAIHIHNYVDQDHLDDSVVPPLEKHLRIYLLLLLFIVLGSDIFQSTLRLCLPRVIESKSLPIVFDIVLKFQDFTYDKELCSSFSSIKGNEVLLLCSCPFFMASSL